MDSEILNSKYIKYSKGFLNTKQKTVQCAQFSNHLHVQIKIKTSIKASVVIRIFFVSIIHIIHALLVRSM